MRWLLPLAAGVIVSALSAVALADDKRDCLDNKDHDLRIQVCSAIIQRDPRDPIAYHNRGSAYGLKGDLDRAISDYNKAITLNPNYAPAYNGRGRAYASKGDYTHAVADVTKATELAPKSTPRAKAIKPPPRKAKAIAKPVARPKQTVTKVARPKPAVTKEVPEDTLPAWALRQIEN
jgi:tetratricopeptide (TPR) repeat protein